MSKSIPLFKPEEIEEKKVLATQAQSFAQTLTVENDVQYGAAMEEGKRIKDILSKVEDREDEITKPMNDALKSVRALFKPIKTTLEQSLSEIKTKMLQYHTKKEAEAKAEEDRIRNDKRLKDETKENRVAEIAAPVKTVKSETAKVTMREDKTWVVVDVNLIPREFMVPDMQAIKASFKKGVPVAGVEEKIIKTPVIG